MDDLSKYLQLLFGGLEGYVYCPVKKLDEPFVQKFFSWPSDVEAIKDWITTSNLDEGSHVYISPALYKRPGAKKPDIEKLQTVWVEFDGKDKIDFKDVPIPTAIVQSSSSTHLHCYWKIPPSSVEVNEEINRRLTYYLEADLSGQDATQLLRPPSTVNRKYPTEPPVVLASLSETSFQLDAFDVVPDAPKKLEFVADVGALPNAKDVMRGRDLPNRILLMVKKEEPPVGSRSSFMVKLAYELAEEGLNHVEIVSLLHHVDTRIKKFEGRTDQLLRLTQIAELAIHKIVVQDSVTVYSYDDILTKTKDIEWILNPWLFVGGMLLMSSAPNVGKTQLCLQLVSSLALGENFLGMKNQISSSLSILFMSLEMPPEGLKYIMSRQRANLSEVPSDFHILTEEASFTKYENIIDEKGIKVVLIDSLTELLDEAESESESVRARIAMKWTRKIRRRYGCSIIIIHHNRKATEGNKKPKTIHDIAGSFQYGKECDAAIILWEDAKGIEVSSVKCRYGAKEAFYTSRDASTLWFTRQDSTEDNLRSQHQSGSSVLSESRTDNSSPEKHNIQANKSHGELDVSFGPVTVQPDSEGTGDFSLDFG